MVKRRSIIIFVLFIALSWLLPFYIQDHYTIQSNVRMKKVSTGSITYYYNDEENSQKSIEMIKDYIAQVDKNISDIMEVKLNTNLYH